MADARLPERYLTDRQILRLSDAERSSLFMATIWCVSNRTDGRIERADLPLIPTFNPKVIPKLVSDGLWLLDGVDAWTIADYSRTQTSRAEFEVLDNARRRERDKKQRQRTKQREDTSDVPGEVPGGLSRGTAQARQGQARQVLEPGQDYGEADTHTGELKDWPTAIPGAGVCQHRTPIGSWCDGCGGSADMRGAA